MGVHEKKRLTIRRMIKIFLLLSLAILSTTAREDFTHFHDAQSDEVHAPRVIDSSEGLIGGESEELAPKRRLRKHVRVARRLRDNKKVQRPITGSFNHLGFPEFPSTHQFQLRLAILFSNQMHMFKTALLKDTLSLFQMEILLSK